MSARTIGVVVGRRQRRGLFRAQANDLLAAVEPGRVVFDHDRRVEARAAVEDVRLVVVSERMQHVVAAPAVLDVDARARPHDVAAGAAVEHVVAGASPDDVVAAAGVDQVVARRAAQRVGAGRAVDDVEAGRARRGDQSESGDDAHEDQLLHRNTSAIEGTSRSRYRRCRPGQRQAAVKPP
jgi:hypothetical protein